MFKKLIIDSYKANLKLLKVINIVIENLKLRDNIVFLPFNYIKDSLLFYKSSDSYLRRLYIL
jgi:hypothetical protein